MGATIHPHKGYLNTNFKVHVTRYETEFSVYQKGDNNKRPIIMGIAKPNEPCELNIAQPGDFTVSFNNGGEINIHIEDGYKFGGSTYKKSFIFDDCPWCFVIMHDRTYFYNRVTKRSFVEPISPDNITEINEEYVIFENGEKGERTIFSFLEEKPILCITDIVAFSDSVVVWKECVDDTNELCIYVLGKTSNTIDRFEFDGYAVDKDSENILFYKGNTVKRISLSEYNGSTTCKTTTICGKIVSVIMPNIVVSYRELYRRNELTISNIENDRVVKRIDLDGFLAEINGEEIIDTRQRQQLLSQFDVSTIGVPELMLSAKYNKIFVYTCDWDVFYSIETISLIKDREKSIKRTSESKLYSINTGVEITIQQARGKFTTNGNAIGFYNDEECFVRSASNNGSGYHKGGNVYIDDNNIYLYNDSHLYKLSPNGYWDNGREIKIDFSDFNEFGILRDKDTGICQTLSGIKLGKWIFRINYNNKQYIRTSENYIISGGRRIKASNIEIPNSLSTSLKLGLSVSSEGVYICNLRGTDYTLERILENVYDSTEYKDVLMSEDGNCFMHKNGDKAITFNICTGVSQTYDNLSYIKHVNGIRPLFSTPASLQPVLVNPVTKQRIDTKEMSSYHFVSPDGKLYADTRLQEYTEFYLKATNEFIPTKKYNDLLKKCTYPRNKEMDSIEWKEVTDIRKAMIISYFTYLNEKYGDTSGKKWDDSVLDKKDEYGVEHFLECLIGVRGMAVIRNSNDDSEYTRINLGAPLKYINYVSFSYDSKYVAIAGYRNSGGLFIVYDLETNSTIVHEDTARAVWNAAFSANNALASYTSEPKTFFSAKENEYVSMCNKEKCITGSNFLTFSPDGAYFALSQQGYVSKYDKDGNVRDNWGHQPSSLVEIRRTLAHEDSLIEYSDLGDSGISETSQRESVASVSFSNDNKRLMMVGNDGVVIIRNLNFEDYASK